ncbi:MAG: hypothetical protein ACXACT_17160, partial [Candidatus Thorarchaeota archaeon]
MMELNEPYGLVTRCKSGKEKLKLRTDTAQRILWFATVFIVLMVLVTLAAAVGFAAAMTFIDIGSFISDPTILAFLTAYPLAPTILLFALAGLEIIFLAVLVMWRKDPIAHRTGFTIIGIFMLLAGFSLPGLLILLPGLL